MRGCTSCHASASGSRTCRTSASRSGSTTIVSASPTTSVIRRCRVQATIGCSSGWRAAQPGTALRVALDAARAPRAALHDVAEAAGGLAELFGPAFDPVSRTPLNVEVGPHRRFDWTAMRVSDLKAVKKTLGGTLNDVVLATVSGALRRFFRQRGVDPDRLKIRAMVPVSVRTQDERGALGNRVTQINAPIPVELADPAARLDAVRVTLSGLKESRQALGGEVLTPISEWTVSNLLVQAVRLAAPGRPYNPVGTNG